MTEKKRSFVMYNDYLEYFGMLEDTDQGKLIMLVLRYVNGENVEPEKCSGMVRMAFAFIRRRLDEDAEKYEQVCANKSRAAKARESAKREKSQTADSSNKPEPAKKAQKTQLCTKSTTVGDNDNVSDSENDSDIVNVSGCDNVVVSNDNSARAEINNNSVASAPTTVRTTTTTTENNNYDDDDIPPLPEEPTIPPVSYDRYGAVYQSDTFERYVPYEVSDNSDRSDSFIPPSFEDVWEYCREENIGIDAKKFIDYYNANGWRVGKNPMKDWQAAVRVLQRNERSDKNRNSANSANSSSRTETRANTGSYSYTEHTSYPRPQYGEIEPELYELYKDL